MKWGVAHHNDTDRNEACCGMLSAGTNFHPDAKDPECGIANTPYLKVVGIMCLESHNWKRRQGASCNLIWDTVSGSWTQLLCTWTVIRRWLLLIKVVKYVVRSPCRELHWTVSHWPGYSLHGSGTVIKVFLFRALQYTYTGCVILSDEEINQHPQNKCRICVLTFQKQNFTQWIQFWENGWCTWRTERTILTKIRNPKHLTNWSK